MKHHLKVKCYIRYVDDFVILHKKKECLEEYEQKISGFLKSKLALELHPGKSKIRRLKQGTNFLGYRIFFYHKLLRKANKIKVERKLQEYEKQLKQGTIIFDKFENSLHGWCGYAKQANTFRYRKRLMKPFEKEFIKGSYRNGIIKKVIAIRNK